MHVQRGNGNVFIFQLHMTHSLVTVYNNCGLFTCCCPISPHRRGEILCQHLKVPLAATISPYFDLTHPATQPTHKCEGQMKSELETDHHIRDYVPYSVQTACGSLNNPQVIMNKCCETGPTAYCPYIHLEVYMSELVSVECAWCGFALLNSVIGLFLSLL